MYLVCISRRRYSGKVNASTSMNVRVQNNQTALKVTLDVRLALRVHTKGGKPRGHRTRALPGVLEPPKTETGARKRRGEEEGEDQEVWKEALKHQ